MSSSFHRIRHETINHLGPEPTNPVERLAHVLAAYADTDGSRLIIEATSGTYGSGIRTGLTLDDLRDLHAQIIDVTSAETHCRLYHELA